jgi:hypothetical protein
MNDTTMFAHLPRRPGTARVIFSEQFYEALPEPAQLLLHQWAAGSCWNEEGHIAFDLPEQQLHGILSACQKPELANG